MKNLILIIAVIVLSACASVPTMKSVAGTYERKYDNEVTVRVVLLENGIVESYANGKKEEKDGKWKFTKEGEIHASNDDGDIVVLRINEDSSLTLIEAIEKAPNEEQVTLKKIKSPKINSVAGTYQVEGGKIVFLDDGSWEAFEKDGEIQDKGKWEISKEGEIHATDSKGDIGVFRINEDSSITMLEVRKKAPKKEQIPFKKIK